MSAYVFTSESVTEGHPDKVCDFIADSILDAHLAQDPGAHVACEVLCKGGRVVVAGEITSAAKVDVPRVVREAIAEIGYTNPAEDFCAEGVEILDLLTGQEEEIRQAVDRPGGSASGQGARRPGNHVRLRHRRDP